MTENSINTKESQLLKSLTFFFVLSAVLGVIAGGIHLFSILSNGFTSISLTDALINILMGILAFICSRLLTKGRRSVIFLYSGIIVISIGYAFAVGRGLNIIFTVIGLVVLGALIQLWRRGQLV